MVMIRYKNLLIEIPKGLPSEKFKELDMPLLNGIVNIEKGIKDGEITENDFRFSSDESESVVLERFFEAMKKKAVESGLATSLQARGIAPLFMSYNDLKSYYSFAQDLKLNRNKTGGFFLEWPSMIFAPGYWNAHIVPQAKADDGRYLSNKAMVANAYAAVSYLSGNEPMPCICSCVDYCGLNFDEHAIPPFLRRQVIEAASWNNGISKIMEGYMVMKCSDEKTAEKCSPSPDDWFALRISPLELNPGSKKTEHTNIIINCNTACVTCIGE